jgi:hypothetical protein
MLAGLTVVKVFGGSDNEGEADEGLYYIVGDIMSSANDPTLSLDLLSALLHRHIKVWLGVAPP